MNRLIGRTPVNIAQSEYDITFTFDDGSEAHFYHEQDCCEGVWVEDVCGDWNDLIGTPLLVVDERSSFDCPEGSSTMDCDEWTFYTFRSNLGSVDVRWHGTSNGYYSTAVSCKFTELKKCH